jgi:hypothetical protein
VTERDRSACDEVVEALCRHYGLSPRVLRTSPVLPGAIAAALSCLDAGSIVARIVDRGPLTGARDPYALLVARARQLVSDIEADAQATAEETARRSAAQLEGAVRYGRLLAGLVTAGEIDAADLPAVVESNLADPDLAAIALAASGSAVVTPAEASAAGANSAGRCPTCRFIAEHGWTGPRGGSHCQRCHRSWHGKAQAHCPSCCRHFSAPSAFDRHLRTAGDGSVTCVDPATLRTRAGAPVLVSDADAYGPIWRFPGRRRYVSPTDDREQT